MLSACYLFALSCTQNLLEGEKAYEKKIKDHNGNGVDILYAAFDGSDGTGSFEAVGKRLFHQLL
jgi:hypothetical protein